MGHRIGALLAGLAVILTGEPAQAGDAGGLPNIVVIVADDLGWTGLGCYGSDLHATPRLDRLAGEGVRFTSAYAAAPVCSPTRAALLTGKYPARLHMTIWREASAHPPQDRRLVPPVTLGNLPHEQATIAELLQAAGYATAHVGKWHLGDGDHYPESHGFDVNVGGTHWGAPATYFFPYRGGFGQSREFRYVPGLPFGQGGEYLTDRLTSEALRIIEQVRDRPFFLHLAYHTVHTPLEGKPELVERYRSRVRDGLQHANPVLAAMVHSVDENVGRVLDGLDRLGLAERTLVVFTSDNGGFVNEYRGGTVTSNSPLRSGKGSLYEGGLRVPLIVRWPGVARAGEVCAEPVVTCDLFSTLLEAAGVGLPTGAQAPDGVSVLSLLQEPEAKLARDALFFHYPHYYATTTPVGAIRAGEWKLLEYFEDERVELYHLPSDIGEARDVAGEHPRQAEALVRRLREWREEVEAQMPAANAHAGAPRQ